MKKTGFVALLCAFTLVAGTAAAQPAPYNDVGVTMGHWHIASKDVEANKKLFLAMGGKLFMPAGNPLIMFPGIYINLNLGTEKGDGETVGSVVNHVGFIVDNVEDAVAALERVETLSRAGVRADFEERFSAERMALDYVDIYAQLPASLTKRRAKPPSPTQTAGPLLLLPGPRNIGPITTPSKRER